MAAVSRRVLLGALALGAAACSRSGSPSGSGTPAPADAPDSAAPGAAVDLAGPIADLERRYNAYAGVYARDLVSGRVVSHRADDPFAMCSTFKVYACGRTLQQVAAGRLGLSDPVQIRAADLVANSPVTQTRVGATMTVAQVCAAALQRSDNTAGNKLLGLIGGPPAVTAFARSIGDQRTRLDRQETALNSAIPGDPRDTTTPHALGAGFERLLTGNVLAARERDQLVTWMRGNQTSSMRAGLPAGWLSTDKTGSGDYGSTNDVGVVDGPGGRQVLLAFLTRSQADDPQAATLRPLVGELATLVLNNLHPTAR